MDKKKAIKLATASAVAASAFVAANPNASEAATNVASVVSQAKAQFKNAYYAYSQVTSTGQFADINKVYAEYNKAKKAYADAVALVKKAGGANKDALLADLDATYNEYVAKRVVTYLDAYNYAVKLDAMRKDLQAAVDAKDLAKAEDLYNKISYELKKRTVILDRVYGQTTRDLLRSQFKAAAQQLRDSLMYDITVSVKLKAAEEATNKGDLAAADAALKAAQDALAKATAFKTELTAKQATVQAAYEAKVTPKVESVSAINAKQLVVKFNKPIKTSTIISNTTTGALVANTVTVSRTVADPNNPNKSVTSVTGSLSEDGKTLTLTATGATYFDGTYALTIADSVETTDGKKLTAYSGIVTASDKVAPTISKVEYNPATGNIEVTTSEPLIAAPDVLRINGTPVTGLTPVANTNNTKFTVTKPASVAAGSTASVYLAGGTDYAGNILTAFDGSVVITNDQSDVQVTSVTQLSSNKVKIVFNKPIASSNATIDNAITALIDGQTVGAANVTFAKDVNDATGKTVIATFDTLYTAPNYFYGTASSKVVTFVFANDQITDVYGKKLAATTQTVTMNKDVTGPKAVSAKVSQDGKYIEIKFDEVITNLTTGASNANITLRKDGVAVAMNGANASVSIIADENGDNKVLRVSPDSTATLAAGTYTVRLAAGTVQDVHTNSSDVVSINATVDSTTTNLTATLANLGGANNQFQVTFSEAVGNSALERTNYTLDGKMLPEGTDIYFADSTKTKVNIVLPANSINVGAVGGSSAANNAILGVSNVTTPTGKVVVATSGTVKVEDNTAAILQSATLVANNVLKLTFNENISASFTNLSDILDDIQISNGTTSFAAGDATATVSVSGKDLVITVVPGTTDNWSTVTSSSTVTVKTLNTGDGDIKDVNGVIVKGNVSVTLVK